MADEKKQPVAATQQAKKAADAIQEMRQDYDVENPVLANIPVLDIAGEVAGVHDEEKGAKRLLLAQDGPLVTVSIGGESIVLDHEGLTAAQRQFAMLAASL